MRRRPGRPAYKNLVDLGEDDAYDAQRVADCGIYFSSDGLRMTEEVRNVRHKKRRVEPSDLNDALAEWVPVREEGFSEDAVAEGAADPATVLGKRKVYTSTVSSGCKLRCLNTNGIESRWIQCLYFDL